MKREEIIRENKRACRLWDEMISTFNTNDRMYRVHKTPLRSCNARVLWYEADGFDRVYLLQSYETIVAGVMRWLDTDGATHYTCVDMLRYEYGYTSTSAQHIAKFFTDYARFPARVDGCVCTEYRFYPVKGFEDAQDWKERWQYA